MVAYAEAKGALLLLENLNKEPAGAEVHYLAHTLEEWRWYYERIDSPAFALSFTANHAHLVPEGVAGFVEAMPVGRVVEVRLADCFRNGREEHLRPGDGDFDFAALFRLLEAKGFDGHYMTAFGSLRRYAGGPREPLPRERERSRRVSVEGEGDREAGSSLPARQRASRSPSPSCAARPRPLPLPRERLISA